MAKKAVDGRPLSGFNTASAASGPEKKVLDQTELDQVAATIHTAPNEALIDANNNSDMMIKQTGSDVDGQRERMNATA